MALTIAISNTKGGVGKTTSTVLLACALTTRGMSVEVWDADPQGSATAWLDEAAEVGPVPFPHSPMNAASLRRRESSADVLLIDTPPGESTVHAAVLARADLVIVPTAPSGMDMARVWATLDALNGAVPAVVLLNTANTRTNNYKDAVAALDAEGVPRFETPIPSREAYKRAVGTIPSERELGQWSEVAAEIEEMIQR